MKQLKYAYYLFFAAFLGYISNLMITPLFRSMAADLAIDVEHLGTLVTIYGITAGFIALFAGALSDKYGRRPVLLIAACGVCVCSFAFSVAWSLPSLAITRIATALFAGPLMGCALASIPDYIDKVQQGRAVGIITSAVYMSSIVGVPIGLMLSSQAPEHWRWAFMFVGALAFVAACVFTFALPSRPPKNASMAIHPLAILRAYRVSLAHPGRRYICLTYALVFFAHGMYITYYPSYLMINRELSLQGMAAIFLFGGAGALAATQIAGRFCKDVHRLWVFIAAALFLVTAMLAILYTPSSAASIFFVALPIGMTYMASDAFRITVLQMEALSHSDDSTRGAFMGLIAFITASCISAGAGAASAFLAYSKAHLSTHVMPVNEASNATLYLFAYDYLTYTAIVIMLIAIITLNATRTAITTTINKESA